MESQNKQKNLPLIFLKELHAANELLPVMPQTNHTVATGIYYSNPAGRCKIVIPQM